MSGARPPEDPGRLKDFPAITLQPDEIFYRIHRIEFDSQYFCNDGECRFDPPLHSRVEYGTCYLARSPEGAFLETLGRIRPLPEQTIVERAISTLAPTRPLRLADLNHPSVIGRFGVGGDLSVGPDYTTAQAWGHALRGAGFEGVSYVARHDPRLEEHSVALFGPPGEHAGEGIRAVKEQADPLGDDLLRTMQEVFGIMVVPASYLD